MYEKNRQGDVFITLLRAVACLLIINSHCRNIYPLFFLAIGGGHGNAIFFVISGYCLAKISRSFPEWYGRRIKRILPITLVTVAFSMLLNGFGDIDGVGTGSVFRHYLDEYWFVWAILLYYCVFYVIFRQGELRRVKLALSGYVAGYFLLYWLFVDKTKFSIETEGFVPFKVYFYFGIFLVGGLIRLCKEDKPELAEKWRNHRLQYAIAVVISGAVWCAEYALVTVLNTAYVLQFVIHISVFMFAVMILLLGITLNQKLRMPKGICGKSIQIIADSTLEIYLVQITILPKVLHYSFPVNWLLFVVLSIGGGVLMHVAAGWISHYLQMKRR